MANPHRICVVEGCGNPAKARGMCSAHWQRWRKEASGHEVAGYVRGARQCSIDGCLNSARRDDGGVRGLCRMHYARFRRHGDPMAGRTFVGEPLRWIEDHANYQGEDCIRWPFSMTEDGPSTIVFEWRHVTAGRVMCILAHGSPPTPEHETAHSCGNGHLGCMNRRHLRWATAQENQLDAIKHGTQTGLRYFGSAHFMAKLDEEKVRTISALMHTGLGNAEIARRFGVEPSTISSIRRGRTWRHVTNAEAFVAERAARASSL